MSEIKAEFEKNNSQREIKSGMKKGKYLTVDGKLPGGKTTHSKNHTKKKWNDQSETAKNLVRKVDTKVEVAKDRVRKSNDPNF